jgi:hypothetical protein
VYAWLCQLRVAPYSYDLLDNFGRRSPRARDPELRRLAVGQRFMTIFRLMSYVDDEQLTLRSTSVAVTYAVRAEGSARGSMCACCSRARGFSAGCSRWATW